MWLPIDQQWVDEMCQVAGSIRCTTGSNKHRFRALEDGEGGKGEGVRGRIVGWSDAGLSCAGTINRLSPRWMLPGDWCCCCPTILVEM